MGSVAAADGKWPVSVAATARTISDCLIREEGGCTSCMKSAFSSQEQLPVSCFKYAAPLFHVAGGGCIKAGWSYGYVSALDRNGRTIWIADAHRDDGKRFIVRADELLTAFVELGRYTSSR